MSLTDLQQQLLTLDPAQKAEAIQLLTKNLSNGSQGITKTPGVCSSSFSIKNHGALIS
jgi:hypothetical protein